MLFRIGKNRASGEIQSKLLKSQNLNHDKMFLETSKLAIKMKDSLLKGRVKKFGDYLNYSWNLKKSFNPNVTNNFIDECYKLAKDCGALGGKLLGAGAGGFIVFYAKSENKKKLLKFYKNKKIQTIDFKFE